MFYTHLLPNTQPERSFFSLPLIHKVCGPIQWMYPCRSQPAAVISSCKSRKKCIALCFGLEHATRKITDN